MICGEGPRPGERIDPRFLCLLVEDGWVAPAFRRLPPHVTLTRDERERAAELLPALGPSGRLAVLLLPEAGMTIKEGAPQRYRTPACRLMGDGFLVLVAAGAPGLARVVAEGLDGTVAVPPLALRNLAALAAACAAYVAGDTGPARLASAVGAPTLALYGPTWAGRFGLREDHGSLQSGLPCHVRNPADQTSQACWYSGRCVLDDRPTCADDISVDEVLMALATLGEDVAALPRASRRTRSISR